MHLGLRSEDVGTLRAIDGLRDDEYHYLGLVSEGILYVHLRAAVSIVDRVLRDVFGETLSDQLPARVLPISTEAPRDLDVLIDEEFSQVRDLLGPGRKRRTEARARIRTLLALEGHVVEGVEVSETDVDRLERAIRDGDERGAVFPRLIGLTSRSSGVSVSIKVQTSRREGMPVRLIDADDPRDAAAVREVDLQRKFCFSKLERSKHLDLTPPRCAALRAELAIDGDPECHHQFQFGQSVHDAYSGFALQKMRDALAAGLDMAEVWARRKERRRAAASR